MAAMTLDAYDGNAGELHLTNGGVIRLSPVRRAIFEYLLRIKPSLAPIEQLRAVVYGGSDGPADEARCLHVHLLHLARQLAGCTVTLVRPGHGGREPGRYGLTGKLDIIASPKRNSCPTCGQKWPDDAR